MKSYRIINILIAAVWFVNGLVCKVLNLVPRHQQIVARIIGAAHAGILTRLIGATEIAMCIWVVSGFKRRLNAITQAVVIASMNTLEFLLAPDLLLWGRYNALFAFMFIILILCNEFCNRKIQPA